MPSRVSAHRAPDPPEAAELRRLAVAQPELASAVDLQLALLGIERRVASRIPLPTRLLTDDRLTTLPEGGTPLLRFDDLPLEWSDVRLVLRETLAVLHRADIIDAGDERTLAETIRDGSALPRLVREWFEAGRAMAARWPVVDDTPPTDPALDQFLVTGLRPFLARAAEAIGPRLDLASWGRGVCPLCGGEPELGVLHADGESRDLACGRCRLLWPFPPGRCHACGETDAAWLLAFRSGDGRYRLDACDRCRRYLKSVDERRSPRLALPVVDTIATLPLDAAAVGRGYGG